MLKRQALGDKNMWCSPIAVFFVALCVLNGCAGLQGALGPVSFKDPYAHLAITETAPLAHEEAGVILRFQMPDTGELIYDEDTLMYAQIKAGEGKRVEVRDVRRDSYSRGITEDSIRIESEMTFSQGKEKVTSALEISGRGEILRFISGSHRSRFGSVVIRDWSRSALFPEGPVSIGQSWQYAESIDVQISSWLVKDRGNAPYEVKALSTLDSFAYCMGVRCAVIKTVVVKEQEYHLRIFFKELDLKMRSRIDEITYFDYEKGVIVAQVIKTLSQTTSVDPPLVDNSEGQSIISLRERGGYETQYER